MTKEEAIDAYVKEQTITTKHSVGKLAFTLCDYEDADPYCIVNDGDKNLLPIYVPLPKPPPWHLIDGFGEDRSDQVFTRTVVPERIKRLEKKYGSIAAVWDELEQNPNIYKDEIAYIKKQIWHELNGYWFFCNGKPTYIPGDFYVVLNFWRYDSGLPEYRDRDRKVWLFDQWLEKDERFAGFNYPKHRREGATSKAGAKQYLRITKLMNADGGIQSKTEEHAENVFMKHVVRPWKTIPFWLKPEYDGTDNPKKTGLIFVPPARSARLDSAGRKSGLLTRETGLGSTITFKSSDVFAYDSYLLYFHHGDEVGKTKEVDTNARYFTIRECLAEGADIHGWCWNTSTVEDMDQQGGENFKKTCDDSHYHDIFEMDSGRTKTWLANLFIPATEGRKGFVGKYGESIIHDPTIEQLAFLREKFPNKKKYTGALEDIMSWRKSFEDKGDMSGLMGYKRKYPLEYADCWISANLDTGMPHHIIQGRMTELSFMLAKTKQQLIRRGNFKRVKREQFARVVFVDDPDGRFEISYWFDDEADSNRMKFVDGKPVPLNTGWGVAGADPFAFSKNKNRRMSNGGGAVFMYRSVGDTEEIERAWEGHRFVCVYNYRPPTKDEYHEDMAMMCQYYGILMLSENNRMDLIDYFKREGYSNYLKFLKDKRTGRMQVNSGWWSSDATKNQIWNLLRDYYTVHGHREMHMEILDELTRIQGFEKMGEFDLFTACGGALLAMDDQTFELIIEGAMDETDLTDWYN